MKILRTRKAAACILLLCAASVLAGCNAANTRNPPMMFSIVYGCNSEPGLTTQSSLPPSHIVAYVATFGGSLYAFDTGNGVARWCLHIQAHETFSGDAMAAGASGPPAIPIGFSTPALVNGILYTDSQTGYVYAFNANTGHLIWQAQAPEQIGYDIAQGPAVFNRTIYVSGLNGVLALNTQDGSVRWNALQGERFYATPVIAGNSLYVGADNGIMYALDASAGKVRWQFQTTDEIETPPVFMNGTIYLANHDGNVYAIDAATGKELWRSRTGNLITPYMLFSNGKLFIAETDGFVYTLEAASGKLLWRYQTAEGIYAPPRLNSGVLYVASSGIYALRASDGTLLWHNILDTHFYDLTSPTVLHGVIYATAQVAGTFAPAALHELREQDGRQVFSFPIGYGGSVAAPTLSVM